MARVLVVSDDGTHTCEIGADDEGAAIAECSCGWTGSDRGHFEDTVQVAEIHVDQAVAR
jgi:hypothetical protein